MFKTGMQEQRGGNISRGSSGKERHAKIQLKVIRAEYLSYHHMHWLNSLRGNLRNTQEAACSSHSFSCSIISNARMPSLVKPVGTFGISRLENGIYHKMAAMGCCGQLR